MLKGYSIAIVVCIVIAVILATLMLYYRQQAAFYKREWNTAVAQYEQMKPPPIVTQPPPLFEADYDSSARLAQTNTVVPQPPQASDRAATDEPAAEKSTATPPRQPEQERSWRRGSNWLESFKAADPKRYEEMQLRRQEMRDYIQNAWVQRTNYFRSRDTSKMTEEELEEYGAMMILLDETWTLSQRLQSGLPFNERYQVMWAVRSNMVALAPMLDDERNHEYYDLAVGMGHSATEASAFVDYVNQITSNTSLRTIFPNVMHGGLPHGRFDGGSSTRSIPTARQ